MGPLGYSMYTMDIEALSNLVEESRLKYIEGRRPHVIVHGIDLVSLFVTRCTVQRVLTRRNLPRRPLATPGTW